MKRQRLLVEAARFIKTDTKVYLAGKGSESEMSYLNSLISKYRLEDKVKMLGFITEEEKKYFQEKPEWFKKELIVETINAGKLLDSGDNPMGDIIDAANSLGKKSILKVVHTFVPAPIIDMLDKKDFNYWLEKNRDETISIYFSKK